MSHRGGRGGRGGTGGKAGKGAEKAVSSSTPELRPSGGVRRTKRRIAEEEQGSLQLQNLAHAPGPVYAVVLEIISTLEEEPPRAKVLYDNGRCEKASGDPIEDVRQLSTAVIDHVRMFDSDFSFDGEPQVFLEDPRFAGSIEDDCNAPPRQLNPTVKRLPSITPITLRGDSQKPYFVLVTPKLAAVSNSANVLAHSTLQPTGTATEEAIIDPHVELLRRLQRQGVQPLTRLVGREQTASGSAPWSISPLSEDSHQMPMEGINSVDFKLDDREEFKLDDPASGRLPIAHSTSDLDRSLSPNDESTVETTYHHKRRGPVLPDDFSDFSDDFSVERVCSAEDVARVLVRTPLRNIPENLSNVLSRPLPLAQWQSADTILFSPFMDTADHQKTTTNLWTTVRQALRTDLQRRFMIVAAGTSGVGKTKAAYDLGLNGHALVVFATASRDDNFVAPFEKLVDYVKTKVTKAKNRRSKAIRAKALQYKTQAFGAFLLLLIAYLEWVLRVLRQGSRSLTENGVPKKEQKGPLLELALRAQNVEEADMGACEIFENLLEEHERAPNRTFNDVKKEFVARIQDVRALVSVPIVFCHDEAQALLHDEFGNFFKVLHEPEGDAARSTGTPPGGMFYALCLLISRIRGVSNVAHVVCGTNLELTEETLKKYSPAQGMTRYISVATSLTAGQIRAWFASYLTKEAQRGLDNTLIERLQGRPLFASQFWSYFINTDITQSSPSETVHRALVFAAQQAVAEAKRRVRKFWNRENGAPLIKALYISMKLGFGTELKVLVPAWIEFRDAILGGVLNVDVNLVETNPKEEEHIIKLSGELPTARAIFEVCEKKLRHTKWREDPFRKLILSPWLGLNGSDACKGEAYEELFVWRMLKRRMPDQGVPLEKIFEGCLEEQYWPSDLLDLTFHATWALRCDLLDEECFELLLEYKDTVILHFTPTNGKCADIMFLVRRMKDGVISYRLVIIQVKNRVDAVIPDAMESLDMSGWFPDDPKNRGSETAAHRSFREAFARQPDWFSDPVRVVLHRKSFDQSILKPAAYINAVVLPQQPVVLASIPSDFLDGARISAVNANIKAVDDFFLFHPMACTTLAQAPRASTTLSP